MNAMKGTQSIAFSESPYLVSAGSVAGKKEGEGPLGKYFDIASEDDLFGEKTWELAEGTMQKLACKLALKNAGVQPEEVRYLFGGDLLRQGIATSMGAEELQIRCLSFPALFHIRRGTCPCCNDCGGRLWRSGACCNIESFWKCRKRIPFSTWLCESETTFFYLDSDRKRSLSGRKKEKPGADQWSDDWENCGLWAEGFTEHGSVYGTGSV